MPRFEFHLQPYVEGKSIWRRVVTELSADKLYLGELWIELLARAYRLPLSLTTIQESGKAIAAACVFARSRGPLSRRFISLPFSDSGGVERPIVAIPNVMGKLWRRPRGAPLIERLDLGSARLVLASRDTNIFSKLASTGIQDDGNGQRKNRTNAAQILTNAIKIVQKARSRSGAFEDLFAA